MRFFKKTVKPYRDIKVGEWDFKFYYNEGVLEGTYLDISTDSGVFSLKIAGNTHAYGYLLAACEQGLTEQLHGYITSVYVPAMAMTQDAGLGNDVRKSITKWLKRMDKTAERQAVQVSKEAEAGDAAFMGEVAEYADASPKGRKKIRKADKALMREMLTEEEV